MNCVITLFILHTILLSFVSASILLDFFSWSNDEFTLHRNDRSDSSQNNCNCHGPECLCCVDFNLTYIDLGGPGCVQMRYISQEEGIAVNVSYGESLIHSDQVKGNNPAPTCISLLANIAKVCARFAELQPYNDGLKGCMLLEPSLLNEVTTNFDIGCFLMGPNGIQIEQTNKTTQHDSTSAIQTESEGLTEEELIAAVNESAKQGLAFFGNLLGLSFTTEVKNETTAEKVSSQR